MRGQRDGRCSDGGLKTSIYTTKEEAFLVAEQESTEKQKENQEASRAK